MKYMGAKTRIAGLIRNVVLADRKPGQWYVEPFCGGCNVIDRVAGNRIANDSNEYLIAMFKALQDGFDFPEYITKEMYEHYKEMYVTGKCSQSDKAMTGFVGFMASYNGKFFDGYNGTYTKRDYIREGIRNIKKQALRLKRVVFHNCDYKDLAIPNNSIVYCDPPYKWTTKYEYKINHDEFEDWCVRIARLGYEVFVSEYQINNPHFKLVLEVPIRNGLNHNMMTERLYKVVANPNQQVKMQYKQLQLSL